MAYMNQDKKAVIALALKPILNKFGVKATLSVCNGSTICLNVKSSKMDFIGNYLYKQDNINYCNVNPYWYKDHFADAVILDFLTQAIDALRIADWYDRSDIQSDYFNTAYYYGIEIGQWDKPYILA